MYEYSKVKDLLNLILVLNSFFEDISTSSVSYKNQLTRKKISWTKCIIYINQDYYYFQHLQIHSNFAINFLIQPLSWTYIKVKLHKLQYRALLSKFFLYKHSLLLYNIFFHEQPNKDWIELNFQLVNTRRH